MLASSIVAALRAELACDARVDAAFLFGSAARGTMRPDSDIDVAIRWKDAAAREAGRADLLTLLGRLCRSVGRDVDLVDLAQAGPELRRRVYAEGVPIADGDPRRTRDDHVRATMEVIDWEHARALRRTAVRDQLGSADG